MIKQYGQALLTFQEINGSVGPLLDACSRTYPALNKKYQNVIADIKRTKQDARAQARDDKRLDEYGMFTIDDKYLEFWYAADLFEEVLTE